MALEFVCASCGHEQDSMDRRCDACGSVRVILVSMAVKFFGPDWRQRCFGREAE